MPSFGRGVFVGHRHQIVSDHGCESRVAINRDLPNSPHEFIIEGERYIHKPIIREKLIKGVRPLGDKD